MLLKQNALSIQKNTEGFFLDTMNQTKAFTNPVKMVANEIPLKLKLFGATVHGY